MSDVLFQRVEMLHLLWAVPLLLGPFLWARARRRTMLARLAESSRFAAMTEQTSVGRRATRALLLLGAAALLVVALARPSWNPKPVMTESRGRDVVFLLDVSRSMFATDLAPNRLERAKLAIRDCVESLQGDRVALVAFAGATATRCPLTHDYGFFRETLDETTPDSVARGGTLIGDAIRAVLKDVFDDRADRHRDIILITDGDDQESFPVKAAETAGAKGVRLLAIGLGDEKDGSRIPVAGAGKDFLSYQGREVWSRLDAGALRKMADATPGGRYLNVATGTFDLGAIYRDLVRTAEQKDLAARAAERYEEKFRLFLALAFALLAAEMFLDDRRREATI